MAWRNATLLYLASQMIACDAAVSITVETAPEPTKTSIPATSTVSILVPTGCFSTIQGSVIAANLTQTVYELTWNPGPVTNMTSANTTCGFSPPLRLTQGPSTLIYTATPTVEQNTNPLLQPYQPTTIQCLIVGANLLVTPIVPAEEAICTGTVPISGLGYFGTTTILPSDQIEFVGVTVTAGVDKLASATPIINYTAKISASKGSAARIAAPQATRAKWANGAGAGVVAACALLAL